MEKRVSCRGIVYIDNKLVVMYREKNNRVYYSFPGGGLEDNETKEDCVVRELKEEFGIDVKPIKFKYLYESEKSIEYFYLCDYIGGEIGTGTGEEFEENNPGGKYVPMTIPVENLSDYPLLPPVVKNQFIEDFKNYGYSLGNETYKLINDSI